MSRGARILNTGDALTTEHKMNRIKRAAAVTFAFLMLLSLPVTLSAGGAGSSEDPLVTLSYINGTFRRDLKAELLTEIRAETAETEPAETEPSETESAASASGYKVERLTKGQSLRAKDACEIILRSGGALVFVESEENKTAGIGLSDVTGGAELTDGVSVPKQHLLIVPRGDGRGVTAETDEAYFMVRGEYEITG